MLFSRKVGVSHGRVFKCSVCQQHLRKVVRVIGVVKGMVVVNIILKGRLKGVFGIKYVIFNTLGLNLHRYFDLIDAIIN